MATLVFGSSFFFPSNDMVCLLCVKKLPWLAGDGEIKGNRSSAFAQFLFIFQDEGHLSPGRTKRIFLISLSDLH